MSTPDNIRVIKFRVWHVDHWVDDPRIEIGWLHPEPGVCRLAGFGREIEMFTGLTDRNGRDIYEGDIVRYPRDTPGVADDRFYIRWSNIRLSRTGSCQDFWSEAIIRLTTIL